MKLFMPIISVKISKLIPMVLLASILAISFALVTSPNAFASQVQDTPIATYTYPDNWEIVDIQGNGEFISFQPLNEPRVYVKKIVLPYSSHLIDQIVNDYLQMHRADGFEVSIRENVRGNVLFDRSNSVNGISAIGYIWIVQVPNTNDLVVTEYLAEPSMAQQYGDRGMFYVQTKSSPQEPNRSQPLNGPASEIEMKMRDDLYKSTMESWKNFGKGFLDDDDNGWVN